MRNVKVAVVTSVCTGTAETLVIATTRLGTTPEEVIASNDANLDNLNVSTPGDQGHGFTQ